MAPASSLTVPEADTQSPLFLFPRHLALKGPVLQRWWQQLSLHYDSSGDVLTLQCAGPGPPPVALKIVLFIYWPLGRCR